MRVGEGSPFGERQRGVDDLRLGLTTTATGPIAAKPVSMIPILHICWALYGSRQGRR
jgi:hypothetical protein